MQIDRYTVPDEIPAAGWSHTGTCNCNGVFQLKFRCDQMPDYELRYSPGMKRFRLLKYRVVKVNWSLPETLTTEMQKLKDAA